MKIFKSTLLVLSIMTVALVSSCKNNNNREGEVAFSEKPSRYVVEIDAIDYAFKMQPEIKSGWVTFDFENKGHKMHFGMLLKFNSPINQEDLENYQKDRSDENFEKLIGEDGLTLVGGPGFHTQGQQSEMTIFLEPGDYLMSCNTRTEEGRPHYELGMEKFFKVTKEEAKAEEPVADVELKLEKYFIETSAALKAGRQTIAVNHAGGDSFDVHLVKLNDTSSISSTLDFMNDLTSPARTIFETGAEQKMTDGISYLTIDLQPGNYAWVSHEYGAMGMVREFSIEADGTSDLKNSDIEQKAEVVKVLVENNEIQVPSTVKSGLLKFKIETPVDRSHEIGIGRLQPGKTFSDYEDYLKRVLKGEEPGREDNPRTGYKIILENEKDEKFNLRPGTYVLFCDYETENGNFEHIRKGEVTHFEVLGSEEALTEVQ
ncbi:hypothetical protein E0K83_16255 [Gramella sp. BOM4]|nr:hypothetical protein [Christiangramia bathymodioli]